MVPVLWSAQEWLPSVVMAVASVMPKTCTGEFAFLPLCPLPSSPLPLQPQQDIVPPRRSAQEWLLPTAMAVASVMPVNFTGVEASPLPPLPSLPASLLPQQDMVPSRWSAQECPKPAVMAVASVMPMTCTGTEENVSYRLCPLPSWPWFWLPQQDIVPVLWSAQVKSLPVVMAVASVIPTTCTGITEAASFPLPS